MVWDLASVADRGARIEADHDGIVPCRSVALPTVCDSYCRVPAGPVWSGKVLLAPMLVLSPFLRCSRDL